MPSVTVGMDQLDNYVGDEAPSQVSTILPEQDDKLLPCRGIDTYHYSGELVNVPLISDHNGVVARRSRKQSA